MNLKISIWISLIIGFNFSLQATTSCSAPSPQSAIFNNLSNDNITLSWEEVPDAASYLLVIQDETGVNINSLVLTENTYIQDELEANQEYSFFISASYCDNGPYGAPLLVKGRTTIIIIDDIIQLNGPGSSGTTQSCDVGSSTKIVLPPKDGDCFIIHVETTDLTPNISFDLAFTINAAGNIVLGNPTSNPSQLKLFNNNFVTGSYSPPVPSIPLFELTSNTKPNGNIEIIFTWKQDVNITIIHSNDCGFHDKKLGSTSLDIVTSAAIYPNPVKNTLNIELSNKGHLEIWDIAGRRWYSADLENNENKLQLSVNSWPKGTYILRWHSFNSPPIIQHLLKL